MNELIEYLEEQVKMLLEEGRAEGGTFNYAAIQLANTALKMARKGRLRTMLKILRGEDR
jgi:hypothetical protein